jgi:hypothetical protein
VLKNDVKTCQFGKFWLKNSPIWQVVFCPFFRTINIHRTLKTEHHLARPAVPGIPNSDYH